MHVHIVPRTPNTIPAIAKPVPLRWPLLHEISLRANAPSSTACIPAMNIRQNEESPNTKLTIALPLVDSLTGFCSPTLMSYPSQILKRTQTARF